MELNMRLLEASTEETAYAALPGRGWFLRFFFVLILLVPVSAVTSWAVQQKTTEKPCEMPLVDAIETRDAAKAARLIESGADLNAKDCNGTTPLIASIAWELPETAEKLILAGANPNALGSNNESPLMGASWYCREDVARLLLARGAEVNAVDLHGYSALIDSVENCPDGSLTALLLRSGAYVNLRTKDGRTALIVAAFDGNEHAVHVLAAAGADLDAKDEDGETALSIARDREVGRKESHDRIYQFLLQANRLDKTRKDAPKP